MKPRLVVDLIGALQDHAGIEVVVDAKLVLLPPNRNIDGRGKGGEVQGRRVNPSEIDVTIPVDELDVLQILAGSIERPIGDLAIESLAADIVGDERLGMLKRHAVFKAHVPVALVVVEVQRPKTDRVLKAAGDVIAVVHGGNAGLQALLGPPKPDASAHGLV